MSFISNNTYRVLGVCSNASLKDIQKNISKLKAFAKIGREMELDYNLHFLNLAKIERTDNLLLKSENQLNLDKNKITSSLFWFADLSPIDAVALAHLIKGDISKTIEIWDKATTSKEVSLKNYSAFNNLSTLLLLNTLDDSKTDTFKKDNDSIKQIKKAIKLKNEFISSAFFNNYCESISKSTPISSDDAQEFFTNTILDLFNKNFSAKELSDLFEGLDDKLKDTLNASLTEAPISNIKSHIDTASNLVEKNKKSGIKAGKQLIKDTLKDIKYLKEISSPDDFQFQSLSDKLSNQILQCGIDCYNETKDDQDYISSYQYALSIAQSEKIKNRAKDCIKHCKEEKVANICSSCNVNSVNRDRSFSIEIFKETEREYNSVRFRQAALDLHYCDGCLDKIESSESTVSYITWGIAILAALIAWGNTGEFFAGLLVGFFGLGLSSWIIGFFNSFSSAQSKLQKHPLAMKYLSEGWQFNKPEA
jgi:hypothetical protein